MDVNFSQIIYYKGKLLGRQLDDQTNEFLYVHFQKRNVLNEVTDLNEKIYFVPNIFTSENGIIGIGFFGIIIYISLFLKTIIIFFKSNAKFQIALIILYLIITSISLSLFNIQRILYLLLF